jgi:hypothetical protein
MACKTSAIVFIRLEPSVKMTCSLVKQPYLNHNSGEKSRVPKGRLRLRTRPRPRLRIRVTDGLRPIHSDHRLDSRPPEMVWGRSGASPLLCRGDGFVWQNEGGVNAVRHTAVSVHAPAVKRDDQHAPPRIVTYRGQVRRVDCYQTHAAILSRPSQCVTAI